MSDLTNFLLARIAEDEAWAKGRLRLPGDDSPDNPARVLAECGAKRRIIDDATDVLDAPLGRFGRGFVRFWLGGQVTHTLRRLALPYADHSDYREAWRP